MADLFSPTNTKGLCGSCHKTRGMHHFVTDPDTNIQYAYCTPPKRGDEPVATSAEQDLEALWEPTPSQCSSCGHVTQNEGKYLYKVNERYRYCLWCQARGGRNNVMRLIIVRALAERECEAQYERPEGMQDCGKCLPCLARKWSDHPFA